MGTNNMAPDRYKAHIKGGSMNFYETQMGQDFFTKQLPQLTDALKDIAKALAQPKQALQVPLSDAGGKDILSDLYYSNYQPESFEWKKDNPLDQRVLLAENALRARLSPEDFPLFTDYESAVNMRNDNICFRAFKAGVQLAVQMVFAGCAVPAETKESQNAEEDAY